MHLPGDVPGSAADGLDETAGGAQEALLVGIQDGHQRHLRQVEALPQQVDPDQDVVLSQPQLPQQFHPAQRVDLGVQVTHPDAHLEQVIGQVLGHLLGQRGDQHPLVAVGARPDLADEVVDLSLGRLHHDLGVDQTGGANHLFDELAAGLSQLVGARSRRQVHGLTHPVAELLPGQRTVVDSRRQPESVLHQVAFAGHIALIHAADLRHGHMRLVDDEQEVLREVVQQRRRGGTRGAAVDMPGVILDAGAEPDLTHHLDVVVGAHPQPLGLQQFAPVLQVRQTLGEFGLDARDGLRHPLRSGDVVRGREDPQRVHLSDDVAGERVQVVQRLDLVAEELDAYRQFFIGGDDLDGVAADPERPAGEGHVVAVVLDVHKQAQQPVSGHLAAHLQLHRPVQVGLRRAESVDARHRSDHDHITAGQQIRGRRMPQPFDVVVDRAVLLDISVRLRDVGLRLVVVVVGHEVLDGVVRQHLPEFVGQLGRECLVGRHHQGGSLKPFDQPCRGG